MQCAPSSIFEWCKKNKNEINDNESINWSRDHRCKYISDLDDREELHTESQSMKLWVWWNSLKEFLSKNISTISTEL